MSSSKDQHAKANLHPDIFSCSQPLAQVKYNSLRIESNILIETMVKKLRSISVKLNEGVFGLYHVTAIRMDSSGIFPDKIF